MRLLILRPRAEAERDAAALRALGHAPVIAPLLSIAACPGPLPGPAGVQALVFTSAQAPPLAARAELLGLPVFAVGAQTAEAARAAGFACTVAADDDAAGLAALISLRCVPQEGALLHLSGAEIARDLGTLLAPGGFTVHRHVVYQTVAATRLPAAAAAFLDGDAPQRGVLLLSPRTARLFLELTRAAGRLGALAGIAAFALSPAVAAGLAGARFSALHVAAAPTRAALLDLLGRAQSA